jgi:protein-S-isoprenylcysteine O-methyltransferase Ste14
MASIRRSAIVSILFTVFGGPGFVLVYFPFWITRFRVPAGEAHWQQLIAAALIVAGLAPLFASIWRFIFEGRGTLMPAVPTERLVVSGLYRYVRNPMYVGVVTSLWGETILFATSDMMKYTLTVWLLIELFIVFYEEPTLARRHPEDYPRYKQHVPRWLPRLKPWIDSGADPAR